MGWNPELIGSERETVRGARPRRQATTAERWLDLAAPALLVILSAVLLSRLWPMVTKPFWFDEQWRAYHVVLPGLSMELTTIYAPSALGWMLVEKAATALFGIREWALRLPMALALPALAVATHRLARVWAGPPASAVGAAVLLVNPAVVDYGLQLKPFVWDALIAVLIFLLWSHARGRRGPWRLACYGVLGLLSAFAIPAVFVLAPLLLLDLALALRRRRIVAEGLPATVAGVLALAHLGLFVRPQTLIVDYPYWHGSFVPHHAEAALRFVWKELQTYPNGLLTGARTIQSQTFTGMTVAPPAARLFWPLLAAELVLVAVGAAVVSRRRDGQGLLAVVAGALALQLVGSYLGLWPFGFTRVNLFLVPFGVALLAAGVQGALTWRPRRAAWLPAVAVLVPAAVVLVAVLAYDLTAVRSIARQSAAVGLDGELRSVVATARELATPTTLAVVDLDGRIGYGPYGKGWVFYMHRYEATGEWAAAARRIPGQRTLYLDSGDPSVALRRFLATSPSADKVLVYHSGGTGRARAQAISRPLTSAGFVRNQRFRYRNTGQLVVYTRRHH
jgi:4-amino-4-deoxy-L-arabinose transferase-like glycosyltransferase